MEIHLLLSLEQDNNRKNLLTLTLRQRIETYTAHGGAWKYLEEELIKHGYSKNFSAYYVSAIRRNKLCKDLSDRALIIFDYLEKTNDENYAISHIKILFLK